MPGGDRPVLERADHLEPGPVADVGEARVRVAAERALEDPAVLGAVEHGAPAARARGPGPAPPVAWSWAIRGLLSSLPPTIVSRKWTCHESAAATWARAAATPPSAMTVWALPRSDLHTRPTLRPGRLRLDRRPQARAAGADDQDVVRVGRGSSGSVGDTVPRPPRSGSPGR